MPKYQDSNYTGSTLCPQKTNLNIKYGFPVFMVTWTQIRCTIFTLYGLNVIVIIVSLCLIYAAIKIGTHIGKFINMIAIRDGSSLMTCMMLVGLLSLIISSLLIYTLTKCYKRCRDKLMNKTLFISVALCLIISIIVVSLGIFIHVKKITLDCRVHEGILETMLQYKTNCNAKRKIDALQLAFQCCGSRGYSEWFTIEWYNLPTEVNSNDSKREDTPFSCCSMHTSFPCIHHDIMSIGESYFYAPESNISISEYGCMPVLTCYTKLLMWKATTCFFVLGSLLLVIAILTRFVQTAHFEHYQFKRSCHLHTSWLFGFYCEKYCKRKHRKPPEPPPFPCELQP